MASIRILKKTDFLLCIFRPPFTKQVFHLSPLHHVQTVLSNLWAAFPVPDDIVQAVGDVSIQASRQVPWFAYPVVVFSSRESDTPVSTRLIPLSEQLLELVYAHPWTNIYKPAGYSARPQFRLTTKSEQEALGVEGKKSSSSSLHWSFSQGLACAHCLSPPSASDSFKRKKQPSNRTAPPEHAQVMVRKSVCQQSENILARYRAVL